MSQVKRYDIETDGFGNFSIGPDTSGRYVTFEDYAAMELRAEAAEEANKEYASLADSWEAHARRTTAERDELQAKLKEQDELIHSLQETVYRYSGPAPAVNLADLVTDEISLNKAVEAVSNLSHESLVGSYQDGFNSCRLAILSNIEEATIPAAKVGSVADTEVQADREASGEEKSK